MALFLFTLALLLAAFALIGVKTLLTGRPFRRESSHGKAEDGETAAGACSGACASCETLCDAGRNRAS